MENCYAVCIGSTLLSVLIESVPPAVVTAYLAAVFRTCEPQLLPAVRLSVFGLLILCVHTHMSDYNSIHNLSLVPDVSRLQLHNAPGFPIAGQDGYVYLSAAALKLQLLAQLLFWWAHASLGNCMVRRAFEAAAAQLWGIYGSRGSGRYLWRLVLRELTLFVALAFVAALVLAVVALFVPEEDALRWYVRAHHGGWPAGGAEGGWWAFVAKWIYRMRNR